MEKKIEEMPEGLRKEYTKYLEDPKRFVRLHPVIYKMLKPYLKTK